MFSSNIYWVLDKLYGLEFEFEACDFRETSVVNNMFH